MAKPGQILQINPSNDGVQWGGYKTSRAITVDTDTIGSGTPVEDVLETIASNTGIEKELLDVKQDKITSTGMTNLLTAPESVGGQPGKKSINDFATKAQGDKADSAYQKPSGGIPKSDLDVTVQNLLDNGGGTGTGADVEFSAHINKKTYSADPPHGLGSAAWTNVEDYANVNNAVQSVAAAKIIDEDDKKGYVRLSVNTGGTIANVDSPVYGLGTAAYAATTTTIASGGSGLPTSGTVYTALSNKQGVINSIVGNDDASAPAEITTGAVGVPIPVSVPAGTDTNILPTVANQSLRSWLGAIRNNVSWLIARTLPFTSPAVGTTNANKVLGLNSNYTALEWKTLPTVSAGVNQNVSLSTTSGNVNSIDGVTLPVTGTLGVANGGTGTDLSAAAAGVVGRSATTGVMSILARGTSTADQVPAGNHTHSGYATAAQGTFADNAVRSVTAGTAATDGTIRLSVNTGGTTANVDATVKGLGAAAYCTVGSSSGQIPLVQSDGKLLASLMPPLAIMNVHVVASQAAMLALTTAQAQQGDIAVRTDDVNTGGQKCYILLNDTPNVLANWQVLLTPADVVLTALNDHIGKMGTAVHGLGTAATRTATELVTAESNDLITSGGVHAELANKHGKITSFYGDDNGGVIATTTTTGEVKVPVAVSVTAGTETSTLPTSATSYSLRSWLTIIRNNVSWLITRALPFAVPSATGNGKKVLGLNDNATGLEWQTVAAGNAGTITAITGTSPIEGGGTSGSVVLSHAAQTIDTAANTAVTLEFGKTFTAVGSATGNATGHVTAIKPTTFTMPTAPAAPTGVNQNVSLSTTSGNVNSITGVTLPVTGTLGVANGGTGSDLSTSAGVVGRVGTSGVMSILARGTSTAEQVPAGNHTHSGYATAAQGTFADNAVRSVAGAKIIDENDKNGYIRLSVNTGGTVTNVDTQVYGLGTAAYASIGTSSGNIPVLGADGKVNTVVLPAAVQSNWNETNSSNAAYIQNKPIADIAVVTTVGNPGTDDSVPTEKAVRSALTAAGNGTITGISTTTPLSGGGTSGSIALSHVAQTVDTSADSTATLTFGGTFTVPNTVSVNGTGHVTAVKPKTFTMPTAPTGVNQNVSLSTTSGNVNSITGVTLPVTGTLGVANGGTGTDLSAAAAGVVGRSATTGVMSILARGTSTADQVPAGNHTHSGYATAAQGTFADNAVRSVAGAKIIDENDKNGYIRLSVNTGGTVTNVDTQVYGLGTAAYASIGTSSGNIPVLGADGKVNTVVLPAAVQSNWDETNSSSAAYIQNKPTPNVEIVTTLGNPGSDNSVPTEKAVRTALATIPTAPSGVNQNVSLSTTSGDVNSVTGVTLPVTGTLGLGNGGTGSNLGGSISAGVVGRSGTSGGMTILTRGQSSIEQVPAGNHTHDRVDTTTTGGNTSVTYLKVWTGTLSQYNAITTKDSNTFYICTP